MPKTMFRALDDRIDTPSLFCKCLLRRSLAVAKEPGKCLLDEGFVAVVTEEDSTGNNSIQRLALSPAACAIEEILNFRYEIDAISRSYSRGYYAFNFNVSRIVTGTQLCQHLSNVTGIEANVENFASLLILCQELTSGLPETLICDVATNKGHDLFSRLNWKSRWNILRQHDPLGGNLEIFEAWIQALEAEGL
jgi:hypothetical protein